MPRLRLTLQCSSSAIATPFTAPKPVWPAFSLEPFVIFDRPPSSSLSLSSSSPAQLKIVCPYARHCCHWLWPRSVGILSQIANEPSQTRHSNANVDMWMHSFDSWIRHSVSSPSAFPIKRAYQTISSHSNERDTLLVNILWIARSLPITIWHMQCTAWHIQAGNTKFDIHKPQSRLDIRTKYIIYLYALLDSRIIDQLGNFVMQIRC